MKRIIYYVLSILCLTSFISCDSDSEDGIQKVTIDKLWGEWIYDHPEEGVWEKQKFMSSGVFYYSNKNLGGWKFSNDAEDGRYSIEGDNRVSMNVVLGGISTKLMLVISEITDYSYTAEYTNGTASVGVFTYAKLLGSVQIKPGESQIPDYSQTVKTGIKGFSSHNEEIAEVDAQSGTITAVAAGHTYVDVITDQGTAVYEVTVFDYDNMFGDYSSAFGKTIPEIVAEKGNDYLYRDDKNGLIYYSNDFLTDTITYITGTYDNTHVEFVQLHLNDNVSQTNIKKFLDGKYEPLSSENGVYNYVTDMTVEGNPLAAIYNTKKSTLVFSPIKLSDLWNDFSYLFGQSDEAVYKEMKEWQYTYLLSDYGYSKDGSDYYSIPNNDYAQLIGYVFNSEKKMCEYWVYLRDDFMSYTKDILNWLQSKYTKSAAESTNSQYVFYDKFRRIKVIFSATGYVSYTDTEQTPFTPATSGTEAFNAVKARIKASTSPHLR